MLFQRQKVIWKVYNIDGSGDQKNDVFYLYDGDLTSQRHSSCLYSLTNLRVVSSDHLLGIFRSVRML